jgi:hypothetical protein
MRLQYPSVRDWMTVEGAIAVVQFGALLAMAVRTRRRAAAKSWTPAVSVIVPCKGVLPERRENLRSILAQQYDGSAEFLFVVQHRDDPAWADLQQIVSENGGGRVRALVSDSKSEQCAGKMVNLVFGVAHAGAGSEVFVFSEDKFRAPQGWLAALATGLSPEKVGVSTSIPLPFPQDGDTAGLCHAVWYLSWVPYFYIYPWVVAPSFAIRRQDYEKWDVGGHWLRCIADDNALTLLAWRHRREIVAVPAATGLLDRRMSLGRIVAMMTRYMFDLRVYTPWAWLGTGAYLIVKAFVLGRALWFAPGLLATVVVGEFGFVAGAAWLSARRFPLWVDHWPKRWRPVWLWAAAAAPAAWALSLVSFGLSSIGRRTSWLGVRYRVDGPFDVRVEREG